MPVIALTNQKGGTGKTTTAVSLAGAFAAQGRSVLIIDLDPSAHASRWLGVHGGADGALSVLSGEKTVDELAQRTRFDGIHVLRPGVAPFRHTPEGAAQLLPRDRSAWDIVLIDTPPSDEKMRRLALEAATHVIIPTEASRIAVDNLGDDIEEVLETQDETGRVLELLGILLCRYQSTRHSESVRSLLADWYPDLVLTQTVRASSLVEKSYAASTPLQFLAPRADVTRDYSKAAEEVLRRLSAKPVAGS